MNKRFIPALALIILAALLACGSTTTSSPSGTPAPTDTHAPATKPTVKSHLQHFSFKGNGTGKTAQFTTTSATWKLSWTCDPAAYGSEYNLIVDVNSTDGNSIDTPVNVICKKGVTSGSSMEYNTKGVFYLAVLSEGPWVLKVQEE